ncbi:MAG: alpha/beta fold hydrolase [Chloroflexales bacterium]|nr:alpha/beta fold hydrolase [Chloroflexales bacterium]
MSQSSTTSFFFPGNATGCLLVHGFSGNPGETSGLGEYLAGLGYTVAGVRLAGHGGSAEAFYASRWTEWLRSVEQGFDELRPRCQRIVIVGFSLGGVLGLLLTQRRSFDGLITMGSRVLVRGGWRFVLSPLLRPLIAWRTPDIAAAAELHQAVRQAYRLLPAVRVPTLVMHGRADEVVLPINATAIAGRIASREKALVWWEQTPHQMLVEGPRRQEVYERIAGFVASIHTGQIGLSPSGTG